MKTVIHHGINILHSAVNCKKATVICEIAYNINYFMSKVKTDKQLNTQNMWDIPVSSVKPKLIFATYEGHTANISQLWQFQKGKLRTNEFYILVFLCTQKSAQPCHSAIPSSIKSLNILLYMSRDAPFSRHTSATDEVTHFSECSTRNRIVRYIQDTQCTSGFGCDRMIVEYTHDNNATRARFHTTSFWSTSFRR
jgi:hypothetical protein